MDPASSTVAGIGGGIKGLRIGIDREYALKGIDAGQAASIEESEKVLTSLGAQIVDVKMPDLSAMLNVWSAICASEALAFHKAFFPARAADYGPYFREFLRLGTTITPAQVEGAQAARRELAMRFTTVLESVDAMACPAGGAPAWAITGELQVGPFADLQTAWGKAAPRAVEFTVPMNLAGTPSITLPSGFSPEGLPYAIQFAGRRLSEPLLFRLAHAYEQATPWHNRHPAVDA